MHVGVRRGAVATLVAALTVTAGGCSGSDSTPAAAPSSSSPPSAAPSGPPPLTTTVKFGEVVGRLAKQRRTSVSGQVVDVVDRWIDHAYIDGHYRRKDFGDAFAGFTAGAALDAQHDRALMTNAGIAPEASGVRAKRRDVTLDVLAPQGHPAGVTARVDVVFVTTGRTSKRYRVRGRLFLTHDPHRGWQVFGYDIARGVTK